MGIPDPLRGATAEIRAEVGGDLTATHLGSGDVPVLATPALLALVERAAVAALAGRLPAGRTSVGTSVELRHRAPTPVGVEVRARVRLEQVEGPRLRFSFVVEDETGEVARGVHTRTVVDRAAFLTSAELRRGEARRDTTPGS